MSKNVLAAMMVFIISLDVFVHWTGWIRNDCRPDILAPAIEETKWLAEGLIERAKKHIDK